MCSRLISAVYTAGCSWLPSVPAIHAGFRVRRWGTFHPDAKTLCFHCHEPCSVEKTYRSLMVAVMGAVKQCADLYRQPHKPQAGKAFIQGCRLCHEHHTDTRRSRSPSAGHALYFQGYRVARIAEMLGEKVEPFTAGKNATSGVTMGRWIRAAHHRRTLLPAHYEGAQRREDFKEIDLLARQSERHARIGSLTMAATKPT